MIHLKALQEQVRTLEDALNTTIYNNQNCDTSDTSSSIDKKCNIDGSIYSDGDFALTRNGKICFCQVKNHYLSIQWEPLIKDPPSKGHNINNLSTKNTLQSPKG